MRTRSFDVGFWIFTGFIVLFIFIVLGITGYTFYKVATTMDSCTPALVQETKDGQVTWSLGCKK